jgi:hypothetical protein
MNNRILNHPQLSRTNINEYDNDNLHNQIKNAKPSKEDE